MLSDSNNRAIVNFAIGGVVLYILYRNFVKMWTKSAPTSGDPVKVRNTTDHPVGNAVPLKTVQPFKKISDYMFSPWDPLNNAEKIEFYDADNMPRTDYILPGGGRLVTYGFVNYGKSSAPAFPTHGTYNGKVISQEAPIKAKTNKKNLNLHTSLWHKQH